MAAFEPADRTDDERRHDDRHRSLREESQAHGGAREHQPAVGVGRFVAQSDDRGPGGERDPEGERKVGQCKPPDGKVAECRSNDQPGKPPSAFVVPAPPARGRQQGQPQPGQRRPPPGRGLVDPRDEVASRHHPVEEDRLLKACLEVVVRRDPVAAADHLAAGLRIECLVGVADGRAAEAREKRGAANDQQQESRPAHGVRL